MLYADDGITRYAFLTFVSVLDHHYVCVFACAHEWTREKWCQVVDIAFFRCSSAPAGKDVIGAGDTISLPPHAGDEAPLVSLF